MIEQLKVFILESYSEVRNKVTWPTYAELNSSTILVIVSSLLFALAIGLVDFVFENGMSWFYQSF